MQIHNAAVTGSFTYNGVDISSITGSTSNIDTLNAITASILSTTASLNLYTGSNDTNISNIHLTTASLNLASGSAITRLNALEVTSGSNITRISALESASGSAITRLSSLESRTGSYATTGSNTFVDTQYVSASNNAIGFTSTASFYTDGGLRVAKDAYISGTLYLNNVTVYGTQSVCFITSSQLNISSNLISVNTSTPSVRFGGLAVYDSGSTGLTGSLLWDSENNHWVYSNPSGSTYSGGMFIAGPRSAALGSEQGTTACSLMMGQGGDHITSSAIFHYGNATCFYGNSHISSSGTACFQGNVIASRIGVGTSVPGQLIDVYKTENDAIIKVTTCAAGAYFAADSQGTDGYYGLVLQNNGSDRWLIGGYATTDLTFSTARTGGSEWLRINRLNGAACFGSTICAPLISFCCNANSGFTPVRLRNSNPGSSAFVELALFNDSANQSGIFYNSSTRSTDGGVCSLSIYNDATTGNIRIRTGNNIVLATGTPAADRLIINSSGNACFSGNVCAQIYYSNVTSGRAFGNDNYAGNFGWISMYNTCGGIQLGMEGSTGNQLITDALPYDGILVSKYCGLSISANNGATMHMRINSTGNVGVNTNSPQRRLHIIDTNPQIRVSYNAFNDCRYAEISWYGLTGYAGATNNDFNVGMDGGNSSYGALNLNTGPSGCSTTRLRISQSGEACFACQVCAPSFIANGDFNIRNTSFSTTGILNKVTWTNLYPSTYNVADIGVQLDGNYYNGAIIFRTADQFNANLLVERLRIESRGVACFSNTICTPTISVGGITPRANLHAYGSSASASTILQTGSQNYVMFGKVIQSYAGAATNIPLFIACPGANNGLFVKIDVRGVNAVGNIGYTSTMYAFQYRIGGSLQATNVVTCPGVNLGNAGYSAGTLCWCNAASSAPVLIYSQPNSGYILEALDVYVTTRDSAEIYFCTNYVNAG